MEAIRSFETSVQFTRSTRRHIQEDGILLENVVKDLNEHDAMEMYEGAEV
jgi:hypothetical protein